MMLLIPLLALVKIVTVSADGAGHDWSYDKTNGLLDPSLWYKHYPACGGKRQSPIDVIDNAIKKDSTLKRLKFTNYDLPLNNLVMLNDGHSIKVIIPKEADLRVNSVSLPTSYRLAQFHFHWPSEHSINGRDLPLELHLVHVNTDLPEKEHTTNAAGLVVVAVFFEFKQSSPSGTALKQIISNLASTADQGKNVTLSSSLTLQDLLPSDTESYIRYSGSLTTPPCAEVVEFHIMTKTLPIAPKDLYKFADLRHEILNANNEETDAPLTHNDRPAQKLNGRTLRLYGTMGDLSSRRRV